MPLMQRRVDLKIIQDGINGFVAAAEEEWEEKLGWLLSDPLLREKLGRAGRETVVERYAVPVHVPRLIGLLWAALAGRGGDA